MSGNKTLYTTVKCRSMTTKEEFVEMWDKSKKEYRTVVLKNKIGWVESNHYVFNDLEDGRIFVELYRIGVSVGILLSMIDIDKIEDVH